MECPMARPVRSNENEDASRSREGKKEWFLKKEGA
jgi:hypothetical protein